MSPEERDSQPFFSHVVHSTKVVDETTEVVTRIVVDGSTDIKDKVAHYAATVKRDSTLTLLAIAVQQRLDFEVLDIKSAFLHAELDDDQIAIVNFKKDVADAFAKVSRDPAWDVRLPNGYILVRAKESPLRAAWCPPQMGRRARGHDQGRGIHAV